MTSGLVLSVVAVVPSPARTPATVRAPTRAATLATFAGDWSGHGRSMRITSKGSAKESISDGCCTRVIDLRLKLSKPRGNRHVASVLARVTSVTIHTSGYYTNSNPAPRVGDSARFKLRYGVIQEPFTDTTYCTLAKQLKSVCGA
jgi:hypothetical protein